MDAGGDDLADAQRDDEAITAAGKTVAFRLTVVDRPSGRDQVTVVLGGRTVTGTLTNGDITTG